MNETIDEVFYKIAKEKMVYWNFEEFKRTHKTLYEVIILTCSDFASQWHKEQLKEIKDFPEYFKSLNL